MIYMGIFSRQKKIEQQESEPILDMEELVAEVDDAVKVLRDVVSAEQEELDRIVAASEEIEEDPQTLEQQYGDAQWLEDAYEGQLSVDVFTTEEDVLIYSAIAGVRPTDVDISINNDMVTIKGRRQLPLKEQVQEKYLQECHWGGFSRTIILPVVVRDETARAKMHDGILEIRIQKSGEERARTIPVQDAAA
jgi:HSP20 family protein